MPPLRPESLTWTALLGRWIEFAQASLAIPPEADGERWRASVPSIINLQAVTFALAEVPQLPAPERALALDKAELLIGSHRGKLTSIWPEGRMTTALRELCDDASIALAHATVIEAASNKPN
jgi:hypothetical protein